MARAGRWLRAGAQRPHAGLRATASLVLVAAVLVAAVDVGARSPSTRVLSALPILGAAPDPPVPGALAPLRRAFVERLLGGGASELLGGALPAPSAGHRRPLESPATEAPPTGTTTTTIHGGGGGLLPPLPSEADLDVAMAADRTSARPGELIRYTVILTNVGDKGFTGDVEIRSHIPFGTSVWDDETCSGVGALGGKPCVEHPGYGAPGPPGDVHTVVIQYSFTGSMQPGRSEATDFEVRVNDSTEPGTTLSNHAHLIIVGGDDPPEASNTVVVAVT